MTTWDVSIVIKYLFTLCPLSELSLKQLTYKLIALIALPTAARALTISQGKNLTVAQSPKATRFSAGRI